MPEKFYTFKVGDIITLVEAKSVQGLDEDSKKRINDCKFKVIAVKKADRLSDHPQSIRIDPVDKETARASFWAGNRSSGAWWTGAWFAPAA
jgi:hypothetical protein